MNLVNEKWIPVLGIDGKPDHASLMEVFTQGERYADLSVRPHERVALMRLLICIAQAALDGPKDKNEWAEAPKKLPKAAEEYLRRWEGSFNLFDPKKPFLQISDLKLISKKKKEESEKTKKGKTSQKKSKQKDAEEESRLTPLSKMDFALATGNNSTLYDHMAVTDSERHYLLESIPVMLLTFLNFFPGGLMSASMWDDIVDEGRTKEGKPTKGKTTGKDAPCSASSMYHVFLRGQNLGETIQLNLLTKKIVLRHYDQKTWGRPVWENSPKSPNDKDAVENATKTYLGRLVPHSRWIKIDWDKKGIVWSAGRFIFPTFEDGFPSEPSATVVLRKKKRSLLGAKPDKAIWRELSALIIRRNQDSLGGALVLENVLTRASFDVQVCALIRKPGQQDIQDHAESVFNVSSNLFTDSGRLIYEKEIEQTENLATKLGWAVETYRQNIDKNWDARCDAAKNKFALKNLLYATATRSYWTTIEKCRHLLMAHINAIGTTEEKVESTQKAWRSAVHKAGREAYISTCGQETSRQIRAFALGWKKLFAEPKAKNEEPEEGGEE